MKYQFEKNLKIINELMTCLHKYGAKDINVKLEKSNSTTLFLIWGEIDGISDDDLDNLIAMLNTDRQHEIEEYYWNLGGESESDGELSLVGMMIDKAETTLLNNVLTFKIYRDES